MYSWCADGCEHPVFFPQLWYIGEEVRVDELFAPRRRAHANPPKLSSFCGPLEAHTDTHCPLLAPQLTNCGKASS